jgi:drug/metabolite transporter (DMT)-like permease
LNGAQHRNPAIGYGLYLIAAALFGFNGTVSKTLLASGISAARLSQLRVSLAFVVMFLVVLATRRAALRITSWAELRLLAVYGVFGVMLTQFLYFVAIHRIPVGIALIIEFLAPFAVALWMRATKGERLSSRVWLGMCAALAGLVLIAQVWQGFKLDGLGTVAAFGAMAALAVYFIMGEAATAAPHNRDAVSVTMFGFAGAAMVWALVQPWWTFPWHQLSGLSAPWGSMGWRLPLPLLVASMVLLGTVTTFWLVVASFKHINAAQASSIGVAEPVLASIIAWALIGESLTVWQVIGIVITGSGILFAERNRIRSSEFVE